MEKDVKFLLYSILFFCTVTLVGCCSSWAFKADEPVEEIAEELIELQTGLEVDLTPLSPEK